MGTTFWQIGYQHRLRSKCFWKCVNIRGDMSFHLLDAPAGSAAPLHGYFPKISKHHSPTSQCLTWNSVSRATKRDSKTSKARELSATPHLPFPISMFAPSPPSQHCQEEPKGLQRPILPLPLDWAPSTSIGQQYSDVRLDIDVLPPEVMSAHGNPTSGHWSRQRGGTGCNLTPQGHSNMSCIGANSSM